MANGLFTPKQAAEWLNVSLRTLYNLPIRRIKLGACTRYDPQDLQQYADLNGTRPPLRVPRAERKSA